MGTDLGWHLEQYEWLPLIGTAGWPADRAEAVGRELLARYAEPHRAYHNRLHLTECLGELSRHRGAAHDEIAVRTALWFHDAVYDPRRSDNEQASADLAADRLAGLGESPERVARVRELILDTAHQAEPRTPDGALVVDVDLCILGKNPDRFDNYDAAIRREYAHVPDDAYRTGRIGVLRRFLGRPKIYRTATFYERYERAARANLTRAIERLDRADADRP